MNNISQFWAEFSKSKDQLAGDNPSPDAMDNLLMSLEKVEPRLYYHLGGNDRGTDLILSAEGHADLMPVLDVLKKAAPIAKGWEIVAAYEGMLKFGERNERVFPPTENGDVLYRMACSGDCLWIAREVNFSLIFPGESSAKDFSLRAVSTDTQSKISKYDGAEGFEFQVEISTTLIPSHDLVTSTEERLGKIAESLGGRNDGWGCFEVQS